MKGSRRDALNALYLLNSSKCVSMPSAPGTEQMRRAFRNVLHLLTRQQCPPSSFCGAETGRSHSHAAQRDERLSNSCLKQLVCVSKDVPLCFSWLAFTRGSDNFYYWGEAWRTRMIHGSGISTCSSQSDLWGRRVEFTNICKQKKKTLLKFLVDVIKLWHVLTSSRNLTWL